MKSTFIEARLETPLKSPYRFVSIEHILDRITFNETHLPKIVMAIGVVRTGTTASLRLFGESGIRAYSQPIKSIMRHLAQGKAKDECGWIIPNDEIIYIKETLGNANPVESMLPLLDTIYALFTRFLVDKVPSDALHHQTVNLMREKLHLVIMGRHPFDTWYSTEQTFLNLMNVASEDDRWYYGHALDAEFDYFILAYRHVEQLRFLAQQKGIPVTHYVYEANIDPEKAISNLFQRIGIHQKPKVSGWTNKSMIGLEDSYVVLEQTQKFQKVGGIFEKVNNSDGIQYFSGKGKELSIQMKSALKQAGLIEIYQTWRSHTEKELEIRIPDLYSEW